MEKNGTLEGLALAQILDGEFGDSHPAAVLDAIGTKAKVRGHGGARMLLCALVETLSGRKAAELRTQAKWPEERMIHFLGTSGFALAPVLVLERSCAPLSGEVAPGEAAGMTKRFFRATACPCAR
ncbi:MAG: hypothetical protein WBX25_18205 [Rhodomicrobium sp.]